MKFQKIELDNLDKILMCHAYDFQRSTEDLPHLRRVMNEKKAFLERVESALYISIRKMFEKDGTKFTEGKLTSEIRIHRDYQAAQTEWFDAKETYEKVDHLREVFFQQEQSLKTLSSLYIAQYWSLSSVETTQPVVGKKKSEATEKAGFKRRGK